MPRKCGILCCLAALLLSLCGCGASSAQPLPQLIIGCDDYEPYHYTDADGDHAGMDVELAQEACARMGYEPVFVEIDWDERDELLARGEIDCLWTCYAMDGQETQYAWVGPYMRSRQIVAVLKNSMIVSLSDLAGKRVAVRVGSKAENMFLDRTQANIPQVQTIYSLKETDEIATALRNDYVDAIAGYASTVREVLQNDGVEFRFLDEELSHALLGVAFAKDSDPALREQLAAALDEMRADGTTKRILEGYGVETDKALGGLGDE